ncbi:3-dehydroquinate synthase [Mycoplasmatota bacterium]|nr:3-dehydroquinate synthase [Mycoplasmatota bacterium]
MKINIKSQLKNYSIHIENHLLDHLSDFIDSFKNYFIITDDGIPDAYLDKLEKQLENCQIITFKQGEHSKNIDTYQYIINQLLNLSADKDDCLIGIGGGVVGDLTGYVASTYLRGIDYIHIPTTLLSQVDSSIGGKTAINYLQYKNIIGSFYPPTKVLIDPQTLHTLSNRHFNNGIVEIIKYGLLASNDLLEMLESDRMIKNIDQIIYQSLIIKKAFVEADEFDTFKRNFLNLGHTLGHAYEAYYQFNKYLHGEAVGLGILKVIQKPLLKERIRTLMLKYQLPIEDPLDIEKLYPFIKKDKKNKGKKINFIVISEVENPEINHIHIDSINDFIK